MAGGSRPDGSVVLNAQGNLSVVALRQALDLALLDHLSGSAAWKGAVTVPKKGGVEFVLDSNLQGVSSSLPDPLGKSAAASLPFRFEIAVPGGGVAGDAMGLGAGVALGQVLAQNLQAGLQGNSRAACSAVNKNAR